MTDQHGRPADVPERAPGPGHRLWLAAEKARLDKFDAEDVVLFAPRIGIGRSTYNRLRTQEDRPIIRTVKKIAATIGMPLPEAMRLAGYTAAEGAGTAKSQSTPDLASTARLEVQALREMAERSGVTLADVLIQYRLARPEELRLTKDEIAEEIRRDPDLPDDLKRQFIDGYRRLREEVAEAARRRQRA